MWKQFGNIYKLFICYYWIFFYFIYPFLIIESSSIVAVRGKIALQTSSAEWFIFKMMYITKFHKFFIRFRFFHIVVRTTKYISPKRCSGLSYTFFYAFLFPIIILCSNFLPDCTPHLYWTTILSAKRREKLVVDFIIIFFRQFLDCFYYLWLQRWILPAK